MEILKEPSPLASELQFAADLLGHVMNEHRIKWRWASSRSVRTHSSIFLLVTTHMVLKGDTLRGLRKVAFPGRSWSIHPILSVIRSMFMIRPCGRPFPEVVVLCSFLCHLGVFCCRTGRPWLVDDLVEILGRVMFEKIGSSFGAFERFAENRNRTQMIALAA